MKTSIVSALKKLKNSLIFQGMAPRRPQHRRSQFFSRLMVENLEDRRLLAILYVDNPGDYIITNDQGAVGLDNGDTVTWDPGAGSQHGGPVTGLTFGTDAFGSIGAAITAATAGDTVQVGPGTFNESVNVSKQLFVLGNQFGVDAQARVGVPESIVDGSGGTPFNVGVSDVVIDGFTIQGATIDATGFGVTLIGGTSGSEIRNNIIQNNIAGLSLANNSAVNPTVIEQNLFLTNNASGPVGGTAIYTDQSNAGGALTNVLIDNNTFRGNTSVDGFSGSAIGLSSTLAGSQTNIDITRNIFDGNGRAIYAFNLVDSSFSENEVMGSLFVGSADIRLFEGVANLTINNNILLGNGTTNIRAVRISNAGTGAPNATGITFERNSISGYVDTTLDSPTDDDDAGLQVVAGQYTGPLDAEFNWWGSATGPTIASNPGGVGEEIVDPDGVVDYIPFLPNGVDTQPAARGFQPSIADLAITKVDAPDPAIPGSTVTYTIVVTNNGPDTQTGATITDVFPTEFTSVVVTTSATGGATGNTAGTGDINDTVTMPPGSTITYTVTGTIDSAATGTLTNTATVTAPADTFETDLTNNSDTETTALTPEADLSVTKTDSPDPVIEGTDLTYTITVTNNGSSDAQGVSLTDVVPAGTTFVSFTAPVGWTATSPAVGGTGTVTATITTLAATDTATFTLVVAVNASTPDGSTVTNTAAVTSTTADIDLTNNTDTETTDVDAQADLSVTKTDSPDPVIAGTDLTYTITVTNNGSSDAQGVSLTDVVPAGTTFVSFTAPVGWTATSPAVGGTGTVAATITTLAATDTATFTLVVAVNASTPDGSTVTNTAAVTSTTADIDLTNNTDTETTDVDAQADLSVTKTDSPDPVIAGTDLTYTITVTNNGSSDAQGVSLTDVVPAGTTFVSFTAPVGWTATAPAVGGTGTVTATITTLAATDTATFTLVVAVNASTLDGSTVTNTAAVASTTADIDLTNNTDTETTDVDAQGDLSVTKTDSPDPVIAGTDLTYTITVTNNGSSDAQGVSLTDVVPAGTTFVSFTAPVGWTATAPAVGGTGTVTATITTLAATDTATFTLVVAVNASTLDGSTVTNTAAATSTTADTDLTNNADTETTDVDAQADLSVTKTDSPDPVIAGTDLTYTITVTNNGSSDAQGVSLTDVVPAGTTFVSFTAPVGWTATAPAVGGTGTVTATITTLAATDTATFTLVVAVNASTPDGSTVTNTAAATSTTADIDLTNNEDTETTDVDAQADLSVTKTDSPDPVVAGTNLTYTITVTNNGSSDAQGVSLTDVVPAGTTFVSFTAPVGWTATAPAVGGTGTVTATITTLAATDTATFTLVIAVNASTLDTSTVTNTAAVASTTTDPTPANNTDTETTAVNTSADLLVTKTDSPDPVDAGSNLTYTLTVTNAGSSDAQGVSLSDLVPDNTTFVSFTAPAGWATTTPAVGDTGTVTATNDTLAAGATGTFTLIVQVNAATPSGSTISNTATVTSTTTDPTPANNSDTETTAVNTSADLSVTKSGTPDTIVAGQNLTYTIVVTNNGVSDAQGVNLSDIIPANTTFVSLSSPAGWSDTTPAVGDTGTVTSTRATLPAGSGPQTFTLIVKADDAALNGETITNTAVVSTTTTDPNPENDSASTSSIVSATADVTVTKTGSSDTVSPGQNLTYTIIVSNNGVVAAQNVSLSDPIPANTTFVSFTAPAGWTSTTPAVGGTGFVTSDISSLDVGASATFTLVVRVDPKAADGSVISNTADVSTTTLDSDDSNNTSIFDVDVTQAGLQECEVTTLNQPGALGSSVLGNDADNPGSGVLIVTGTNKSDVIVIEQRPSNASQIRVTLNGLLKGIYNKSSVQHIVAFGLNGNDTIIVGWNLEQNATLFGGAGTDFLFGGAGKDGIDGGPGNDHLFGGWDNDTLCGGDGNDFVYGQWDNDIVGGDAGNDFLYGESGNDQLQGGIGNDYLFGGIGNDRLFGQAGNDNLFGENGNDIEVGGDGNDRLWGGIGNDLLIGGIGNDTLYGESHDDIVVANSTIYDNNEAALMAILQEWSSSHSYSSRVNNIRNGGGNNGAFVLNSGTVLDDGTQDALWGNGGQDWFLTGVKDKIWDKVSSERVN